MINVTKTDLPSIREYNKYLSKIWKTHWLTNNGSYVKQLESELKKRFKVKYCIAVSNGTQALQLTFRALKLKDEVITTPFTFIATTSSLLWEGLTPVFADINPDTFNIDPMSIEKNITKNTSAILAVHVYGNPCQNEKIKEIAKKYKLKLIYDAAHAFDVDLKGRSILGWGDASILSFHATKVFHTIEGGAVLTNDKKIAKHVEILRNFGYLEYQDRIVEPGINAKMNEFQAAMGLANLKNVTKNIRFRKSNYNYYLKHLKAVKNLQFQRITAQKYNYSYMPVLFSSKKVRDMVHMKLKKNAINSRKYFYPLTSDYELFKGKKIQGTFPVAKKFSERVLCLPLFANLNKKDIQKAVNIIQSVHKND